MDNRLFNVNGHGKEMLAATLHLARVQEGGCWDFDKPRKIDGYYVDPQKGLLLLWHVSSSNPKHQKFIAPMSPEAVTPMVLEWLKTDEALKIPLDRWERDADHDGSNSMGWRVYCEDWGHVGSDSYAFVAIKPVFLWHGK